ncbi:hypothetical protein [Micromonospora echinofusca]|uniref:Uncharacterized protein n=1 Tax=Micromonospora echinofusca TaxID=47858 RepID=A0ABS3VY84_MICEH|nr:hypothetical protein [Micromonospora echinofusca]MBO4209475.1 hypothetical protein [Micromonospora echinofusca]
MGQQHHTRYSNAFAQENGVRQPTGRYAGVIDLTAGEAAKVLDEEQMTALGDVAKQVPFTAVVGADGNLGSLTLELPAAGGQKAYRYVVTYTDYGKAQKIAEPTADRAPAVAYELLNG